MVTQGDDDGSNPHVFRWHILESYAALKLYCHHQLPALLPVFWTNRVVGFSAVSGQTPTSFDIFRVGQLRNCHFFQLSLSISFLVDGCELNFRLLFHDKSCWLHVHGSGRCSGHLVPVGYLSPRKTRSTWRPSTNVPHRLPPLYHTSRVNSQLRAYFTPFRILDSVWMKS